MGKVLSTRVPGVILYVYFRHKVALKAEAQAISLSRIKPHARIAILDNDNRYLKYDMYIKRF